MNPIGMLCFLVALQSENPRLLYVKEEIVRRFDFRPAEVDSLFADRRLGTYPPGAFPRNGLGWREYTRIILSDSSIRTGRDFLFRHRETFAQVEERFGIREEYLVSLLRVETEFGENLGRFRVMNVFYTHLLAGGKRWEWAAENLITLSLYCLLYEIDCFEIRGSHAGAFGLTQFLPTTLVEYALDADGDGIENLFSLADAVASAANYLVALGWHENRERALARYYGSSRGYPRAVERYATAVGRSDN